MEEVDFSSNSKILYELTTIQMPFGKYKGWLLYNLPEPYLVWFKQKGFPKGSLGMMLETLYEIKLNGLEYLLKQIVENNKHAGS
ncbi:MAG: DUF3820 family protein [Bacteroidales bacterium]